MKSVGTWVTDNSLTQDLKFKCLCGQDKQNPLLGRKRETWQGPQNFPHPKPLSTSSCGFSRVQPVLYRDTTAWAGGRHLRVHPYPTLLARKVHPAHTGKGHCAQCWTFLSCYLTSPGATPNTIPLSEVPGVAGGPWPATSFLEGGGERLESRPCGLALLIVQACWRCWPQTQKQLGM